MSLGEYWRQLETKYGLPAGYLGTIRQIESSGNPNAVSPTGATGPFQFTKGTARGYGLPLDKRTDEYLSADAAARLAADNARVLQKALGRAPAGPELYMAHQQGAVPASKLIANPNARQGDATSAFNLRVNSGDPNAPSSDIVNKFTLKYNKIAEGGNKGQGPTKENAAFMAQDMQPQGGPKSLVSETPQMAPSLIDKLTGQAPMGGLVGMAMQDTPVTGAQVRGFMGGADMKAGLSGLAQLAGGNPTPAPAPPPPMIEENRPDMSLLEMIGKKKRKALV